MGTNNTGAPPPNMTQVQNRTPVTKVSQPSRTVRAQQHEAPPLRGRRPSFRTPSNHNSQWRGPRGTWKDGSHSSPGPQSHDNRSFGHQNN